MDKIVCTCCGELKPEIAFELSRGKLRKKCRVCRNAEKAQSHRRMGDRLKSRPRCYIPPLLEATW